MRAGRAQDLQDWRYAGGWRPVEEERLVRLLRQQLSDKLSPTFAGLRSPPMHDEERHDDNRPGVEVRLFPGWFLVDDGSAANDAAEADGSFLENRRRLVEFSDLTVTNSGKLTYQGEAGKLSVNPIRFVGACAKGHLQDIDWRKFAHRGGDRGCRKPLFWVERGVSSDPSDISVRCTCGASVTLGDLYKPKFLGPCECHSPWLTPRRIADEACGAELRLLPRSATNTYFPQTVTLISLTKTDDRVRQAIAEHKSTIDSIRNLPNFLDVLRAIPQTREAFKEFSDDDIRRALSDASSDAAAPNVNPRIAEFDLLATGTPTIGSDSAGSFFYAETMPRESLSLQPLWDAFLLRVVKVHRLREVVFLYGFTRLEPPPTSAESELDEIQLPIDGADLSRHVDWLPAIEQFGEGVFLQIKPDFMNAWLEKPEVIEKARPLGSVSAATRSASIASPFTSAPPIGRSIRCPTLSWLNWRLNAVIRCPH